MLYSDTRKIIHLDCDCFFAAVEMRDNPSLQDKPIAVGGAAEHRGVLATCNYEARKFGLHSAMPTAEALKRCPELIVLPHRFAVYRVASQQVLQILRQYTELVEPVSLDEAYLDVSDCDNATELAQTIRAEIAEKVGITASAGISVNKFLAKIASDWRKPNDQFVIKPHEVADFVKALPVKKIPGVGKAAMQKMQRLQITTCEDLQQLDLRQLIDEFGVFGKRLYDFARGMDNRPVSTTRIRKSVSVEETFTKDLIGEQACQLALSVLMQKLMQRWQPLQEQYQINKVFIKLRYADFSVMTLEQKAEQFSRAVAVELMQQMLQKKNLPVRLLGVGFGLQEKQQEQEQLSFWQEK
jgi:DNA polymerase IV